MLYTCMLTKYLVNVILRNTTTAEIMPVQIPLLGEHTLGMVISGQALQTM